MVSFIWSVVITLDLCTAWRMRGWKQHHRKRDLGFWLMGSWTWVSSALAATRAKSVLGASGVALPAGQGGIVLLCSGATSPRELGTVRGDLTAGTASWWGSIIKEVLLNEMRVLICPGLKQFLIKATLGFLLGFPFNRNRWNLMCIYNADAGLQGLKDIYIWPFA